tara:strand:+ start:491 stop:880 length:390 start_codon:yes stop_codon:yes gene_type:complete
LIDRKCIRGQNQVGLIAGCRALLSVVLVFGLLLAPLGMSVSADAFEHHSHSSMSHHGDAGEKNQIDRDHGFLHCNSFSCSPSFVAGSPSDGALPVAFSAARAPAGDDALLKSLYLDSDPPVPRGGFSKI